MVNDFDIMDIFTKGASAQGIQNRHKYLAAATAINLPREDVAAAHDA